MIAVYVKPSDTKGCLFTEKSAYEWTCIVQTGVVQGSTIL